MRFKSRSMCMRDQKSLSVAILATASLLATIHSHVLAQSDEIPDTVLVTGSLIHGVLLPRPPPFPGRLTQLTGDDLRALLPGSTISVLQHYSFGWVLEVYSFACDGGWTHIGARYYGRPVQGRYFIRDNSYCAQPDEGAPPYCANLYRSETGELFSAYGEPYSGMPRVGITPFLPACPG